MLAFKKLLHLTLTLDLIDWLEILRMYEWDQQSVDHWNLKEKPYDWCSQEQNRPSNDELLCTVKKNHHSMNENHTKNVANIRSLVIM